VYPKKFLSDKAKRSHEIPKDIFFLCNLNLEANTEGVTMLENKLASLPFTAQSGFCYRTGAVISLHQSAKIGLLEPTNLILIVHTIIIW
jgi:hypothetical protein